MNNQDYMREIGVLPDGPKESVRGYLIGLLLSLALSFGAYAFAVRHALSRSELMGLLIVLALSQFFVQSAYFLHIRRETVPGRDRLFAYCSFSIIVAIVVVGSLWVMTHLNARMMNPEEQMEYMEMH